MKGGNFDACKRAADKVEEFVTKGLKAYGDAWLDSMKVGARCAAGDQASCQLLREGQDKFTQLYKSIGEGIVEGAKGTLDGLVTVLDCTVSANLFLDFDTCRQIWNGLKYTAEHPYTLIHLEEWHNNPAKALGLTIFDLSFALTTSAFSGGAGAFTKTLSLMKNTLGRGTGKILDNLADLRSFVVKLHDNVPNRLPGSIGEILSAKVRVENGVGKIDNAVVAIDGRLYRLESYSARLEGDLAMIDGATLRVEGGTLRIENGVAKLDDAKLKVDKGVLCTAGVMSAAATDCSYDKPIVVNGEYRHDIGALKIRISAADHAWGKEQLRRGAISEKAITPDVDKIADIVGARREARGSRSRAQERVFLLPQAVRRD